MQAGARKKWRAEFEQTKADMGLFAATADNLPPRTIATQAALTWGEFCSGCKSAEDDGAGFLRARAG